MIGPYLIDDVTLNQYKGTDEFGTPAARTAVTIKGRIDYKNRIIVSLAGENTVSMAKLLIRDRPIVRSGFSTRPTTDIAYEDTVTFDGVDHTIVRIGRQKDFRTRYMEVWIA